MSPPTEGDVMRELRKTFQDRIMKQLERHTRAVGHTDLKTMIRLQVKQERERLLRIAGDARADGKENLADVAELLARDWLPEEEQRLLARYR